MEMVKNPHIRKFLRQMVFLEERVFGRGFSKMKRVKQVTLSHCGPAVLESLFSYVGVNVSQRRLTRSIQATKKILKKGLALPDLSRAAKIYSKKKFIFWMKKEAKISDLDKIVNKYKFPVGVEWQGVFYENEDEDNGHYSIVTAVNLQKGYLKLADPFYRYAGVDRKFKIKDFYDRWWDTNLVGTTEVFDRRVMFIIVPKGVDFPKKLGMIKR